ncbi:sulfotransferase [Agrilutibacter solisilvae]|uniref:Sulfotransferase n=1 Tax=Agrilutibacter solisilvae TaxID=2763317 RepID=A0A974Y1F2_9GAMM|nr:sulfotransferase [Lysobacter solisilvae]QSX79646.1 sulfotransferase [Lysobacter solisilvae]
MQLIVLGMHRSGTSVLARLLNLMGVYFGPEGISTGANEENPKGFWERKDVRQLNDNVLHAVGCDWNRVLELDVAALPKAVLDDFNKRASKLVLELDGHRPWLLKEPRLCLLLPLWRRFLEVPVGIHIYRNPVEVASSLHKRNKIPVPAGLGLWERYVRSALDASADMPRVVVSHRQLMQEPLDAVTRLAQDLELAGVPGLRMPSPREIEAFVQTDLYRERDSRQDLQVYAKAPQLALFRTLEAGKLPGPRNKPGAYTALAEYEAALPPLQPPSNEVKVTETSQGTLQGQLALREQEIKFVRELSSKYEADLKQRDAWLVRMEESQKQAQQEFQQARERISSLEPGIRARDERIKVLEAAHTADRDEVAKLQAGIRARDERIKVLEAAHSADREQIGKLEPGIRARDERIKVLEAAHSADREQIGKLEPGIRARDERIKVLEAAHEQDRAEVARLTGELRSGTAALERATGELAAARAAALELEAEIHKRDERIHAAGFQAEAARESVARLELGVQKRTAQLEILEKEATVLRAQYAKSEQAAAAARVQAEQALEAARVQAEQTLEAARVQAEQTLQAAKLRLKEKNEALTRQIQAITGELGGLRTQLKAKDTAMRELRELLRTREHENGLVAAARLKVERTLETRYAEIAKLSELVIARDQELARSAQELEASERKLQKQHQVSVQLENELAGIRRSRAFRVLNRVQSMSGRLGLSRKPLALLSHDATLLRQSDVFDSAWYLAQYRDVADSGIDPIEHFLRFGASELRNPGPGFDTAGYLKRNPDVSDSGLNPLLHYITHGKSEGRSPK